LSLVVAVVVVVITLVEVVQGDSELLRVHQAAGRLLNLHCLCPQGFHIV
jgi:hypothetical protein